MTVRKEEDGREVAISCFEEERWGRDENFQLRKRNRWKKIKQERDEIFVPEMAKHN